MLASDLPEIRNIIDKYKVGRVVDSHDPQKLAAAASEMLSDTGQYEIWKENLRFASEELCWEREEEKLIRIYSDFGG